MVRRFDSAPLLSALAIMRLCTSITLVSSKSLYRLEGLINYYGTRT